MTRGRGYPFETESCAGATSGAGRPAFLGVRQGMRSKRPRVALLVETSRGHGRQIVDGVARYAAEHGPWSLRLEPRNLDDRPPGWLRSWQGDGLVVRCDSSRMARAVLATGLPVIDVRGGAPEAGLPLVGVDNEPVADAAFEHFQGRGFRHFAWCDLFQLGRRWIDVRRERFLERVRRAGGQGSCFRARRPVGRDAGWSARGMVDLTNWLAALPRPVAILACDDEQAHLVLEATLALGLRVPDEVAVMGIDNDEVFCRASVPQLSSVDVNAFTVGYEAAAALARLMQGQRVAARALFPPRGVVARQSTDTVAAASEEAAAALRMIRDRACTGLTAADVAAKLAVSRSTLDRLLRGAIGQSATAAIMNTRLARVQADLAGTDLAIKAIARRAGFTSVQHLANLFRDRVGVTPGRYRREMRRS
jgi:LacI family transcriptional regulator